MTGDKASKDGGARNSTSTQSTESCTMQIFALDLDFQHTARTIAAYLVIGDTGPVLVETGPASTILTLRARLAEHGYSPDDIQHVLVTHIHLDHAGAAGWWAGQGAKIYVHHVGAPHIIDPTRLLRSAHRIYGSAMDQLWGQVVPAAAEQVCSLSDGDVINICGLEFQALETLGHASHHMVYRLGNIAFTGDIAGVRLPDAPSISLPAPPPEFDLAMWQTSLDVLDKCALSTIYPTHFGPVYRVKEHLESLSELLTASAEFVHSAMAAGLERDDIVAHYSAWQRRRAREDGVSDQGFSAQETVNPTHMSVDGIMRYWTKQKGT
jgi:glyoxylase-like metal-dependent hydrolase (beta-lactamase superfamily II)